MSYRVKLASAITAALLGSGYALSARADFIPIYGGVTFPAGTGVNGSGTTGTGETQSIPTSSPTPGSETVGSGVGVGTATTVVGNAVQSIQAMRITPTDNGSTTDMLAGLGGYDTANATDAAGDTVGYSYFTAQTGNRRAVFWAAGSTTPVTLNPINGSTTITSGTASVDQAFYITTSSSNSNALRIYGYGSLYSADGTTSLGTEAIRWDTSGNATPLGNISTSIGAAGIPAGTVNARALSANTSDTAVGYATLYSGSGTSLGSRAVRWDANGVATQLGDVINNTTVSTTQNPTATAALSINAHGDAVGFGPTYDSSGNNLGNRAIVWKAGTATAVQLAVPATFTNVGIAGFANDTAFKINSNGEAVGTATTTSNTSTRAIRWDTSTGADTILGDLAGLGTFSSAAFDVNDAGLVAGTIRDSSTFGNHAVVWNTNDVPINLNSLIDPTSGWNLLDAYSISNDDWISGVAQYTPPNSTGTYTRDFLLQLPASAVPEPTCGAIIGLAGLLMMRRRSSGSCSKI